MTATTLSMKRSNPHALPLLLAGKLLAFILALTLAVAVLVAGIGSAFAGPMPRSEIVVKSGDIRLGDVFEGLSQNTDFVLAPAPRPGEELVWNEPTLLRIATAFNLEWRPEEGETVSIRRAATLVDADVIRAVIRDHLASLDDVDTFNVTLSTEVPEIVVPGLDAPRVYVADFSMPPSGGPFSAIVDVATEGGKPQSITLRGNAEKMLQLPVLKRSMKSGSIINAEDITWVSRPAVNVRRDIVREADFIVGTTPRRGIPAGTVIRADDLQKPQVIARGDAVTMIYDRGGMHITAKARAMENGTLGDVIKVSNVGSNKQLEARVTGNREVTVR